MIQISMGLVADLDRLAHLENNFGQLSPDETEEFDELSEATAAEFRPLVSKLVLAGLIRVVGVDSGSVEEDRLFAEVASLVRYSMDPRINIEVCLNLDAEGRVVASEEDSDEHQCVSCQLRARFAPEGRQPAGTLVELLEAYQSRPRWNRKPEEGTQAAPDYETVTQALEMVGNPVCWPSHIYEDAFNVVEGSSKILSETHARLEQLDEIPGLVSAYDYDAAGNPLSTESVAIPTGTKPISPILRDDNHNGFQASRLYMELPEEDTDQEHWTRILTLGEDKIAGAVAEAASRGMKDFVALVTAWNPFDAESRELIETMAEEDPSQAEAARAFLAAITAKADEGLSLVYVHVADRSDMHEHFAKEHPSTDITWRLRKPGPCGLLCVIMQSNGPRDLIVDQWIPMPK